MDKVVQLARYIRENLLKNQKLACHIDKDRDYIPIPKVGNQKIKLIIIGQDPTVKNEKSRDTIKTVLNLDKRNSMYNYLSYIAERLGTNIEQNVYATNLLKCFYVAPPATIPGCVREHTPYWIELLRSELASFPEAVVITLGEPMLDALIINGSKKIRDYWGYQGNNQSNVSKFQYSVENTNLIQRRVFPFPHQPSIQKDFYKRYKDDYISFVNNQIEH
jgi:uracil-DNA glycosylase